jgi:iron complex transport system ATP-binding protein
MLAATDLAFGYRDREVGRGLGLALAPGEVLCVLGPNGAGKTTLFRTLLGLLPVRGGQVTLNGRALEALSRDEIARNIAYVPQASPIPFDFTVREVVEMGRTAHLGALAQPGRRDREIAAAALDRLGIAAIAGRTLGSVSGGERQLALIARALATGARSIVMDEPTASLDLGNQSRVLGEIRRLRAADIAILLCSHDPDHAFRVADRALLLEKGKVLAQGNVGEILVAENLSKLYGVSVHVTEVQTPEGPRRVCVAPLAA